MKVEKDFLTGETRYLVRAYEPGSVRVNEDVITRSFVLTPDRLETDWRPQRFEDLTVDDFTPLIEMDPELILLGTGRETRVPPHRILAEVMGKGIGLEFMDTGAACRTFNVLVGEERAVVAAMLMIERG